MVLNEVFSRKSKVIKWKTLEMIKRDFSHNWRLVDLASGIAMIYDEGRVFTDNHERNIVLDAYLSDRHYQIMRALKTLCTHDEPLSI